MPTISARKLKRLEAAENVARAMRDYLAGPHFEPKWEIAKDWLMYWMEKADRTCIYAAPPVPARWKRNRDKSMGVPE